MWDKFSTCPIQADKLKTCPTVHRREWTSKRSEAEIVRDALEAYAPSKRRLPKGAGLYHSGRSDTCQNAEQILRDAVKEGKWP